jgi:hypothetical protein
LPIGNIPSEASHAPNRCGWLFDFKPKPQQKGKTHMNTEIKLAVAELKEALPGLSKIVGRSRSLPVLQSVRIQRNQEGIVTLHATDLD